MVRVFDAVTPGEPLVVIPAGTLQHGIGAQSGFGPSVKAVVSGKYLVVSDWKASPGHADQPGLNCYDISDGSLLWRYPTSVDAPGVFTESMAADGDTVYVNYTESGAGYVGAFFLQPEFIPPVKWITQVNPPGTYPSKPMVVSSSRVFLLLTDMSPQSDSFLLEIDTASGDILNEERYNHWANGLFYGNMALSGDDLLVTGLRDWLGYGDRWKYAVAVLRSN